MLSARVVDSREPVIDIFSVGTDDCEVRIFEYLTHCTYLIVNHSLVVLYDT